MFVTGETLHAPYLIDVETTQVLRRYPADGEIDSARGGAALDDLTDFPMRRRDSIAEQRAPDMT